MKARQVLMVVLAVILAGCVAKDKVVTVKSPSGLVEAIIIETNGGATTDFGYEVRLQSTSFLGYGTQVASAYGAARNPNAYGMNLIWHGEHALEIQYWRAKKAKVERAQVTIDGIPVTVTLNGNVLDAKAPAGGMLYSLHR